MATPTPPRPSWLSELLRDLQPDPAASKTLPRRTRLLLAEIPELASARNQEKIFRDLAEVLSHFTPELVRKRREYIRLAGERCPQDADVGKALRDALTQLGVALVRAQRLGHVGLLDTACPGWDGHVVALLSLLPAADGLARRRAGRHGRPQTPARGLARRLADVLANHGVEPTSTRGGTFVEVIAHLLDSVPHLGEHDAEWHAKAIVGERRLARRKSGGKSR